ncbi:MAG: DUF4377 domain-containing protein [Chitinophagaceae bacterium]
MKAITKYAFLLPVLLAGCLMASNKPDTDMTLTIFHYKVPCLGESVQLCYLIKKDDGKTEFFHDEIDGFAYQWGFNYTITVEKIINEKPMADASAFRYKLKKVIKKAKVSSEETFTLPLMVDDQSLVETKTGVCNYFGVIEVQTGYRTCAELAKASSALFRHAADKPALILVSLK